jgi:hypothetical protein
MATTTAEAPLVARLPPWAGPAAVAAGALGMCATAAVLNPYRGQTPPCPFHELTGLWCPVCGSSRALHSLFHGDPGAAFGRNPLLMVLLPLLVWAWFAWTLDTLGGPRLWRIPTRRWVLIAFVVTTAAFWVARNLPVHALRVLGP